MRIRKKKWARPELDACSFFIKNPTEYRDKWNTVFKKSQPIYLELGCGRGSFIAQMAHRNENINFIAIDLKDDMLGYARRNIEAEFNGKHAENIVLFAYDIERILDVFSKKDKIDRIYINFCNPWPRPRHRKRRLTHTLQLEKYKEFLKEDGEIHFKTDDDDLYKDTIAYFTDSGFEIIQNIDDLEARKNGENILTEHEKMFMEKGIKIKKIIAKKVAMTKRDSPKRW